MWVVAERGFPGGFHGRFQPEDGSIAGHSFVIFFGGVFFTFCRFAPKIWLGTLARVLGRSSHQRPTNLRRFS